MIHSGDIQRVLLEVLTKVPPTTPDTPELAALRAQLTLECDKIAANGEDVEITSEIP
jgi:hypothetical protein